MKEEIVTDFYILFHNHTDGMAMHQYLRSQQLNVRICPAPRAASVCCGMALLVEKEEIEIARQRVKESGIPIQRIVQLPRNINPHRDHYC